MKNALFLFLISPFLGVIQGFKYYKEDWVKNTVWLFVIFYGFTMYRPEEMDSSRYVLKLQEFHKDSVSWDGFVQNLYTVDEHGSGDVDIYQPLVTYLVSIFTDSGNVLFAVFGLVFGYFYSRNIWMLLDFSRVQRMNLNLWLLIFTFSSIIGFWNLGGVRMWTAAQIFFYGAAMYLIQDNKKGILISVLSILVHFSFILPVALLLFFSLVKVNVRVLFVLFVMSFFISELNFGAVKNLLESYVPDFLVSRVTNYIDEGYVEVISDNNAGVNWYMAIYVKIMSWFILIMTAIIYLYKRYLNERLANDKRFFGFCLAFLSIGNILSLMPSGTRYLLIAQYFALAMIFVTTAQFNEVKLNRAVHLLRPILIFYLVVSIRVSFDTVTLTSVCGNPLIALLVDYPFPLIDLIK